MVQFTKILVPLDFSEPSRKALAYGLALADHFKAEVIVAHIVPESSALAYAFPVENLAIETDQRDRALAEIQTLMDSQSTATVNVQPIVKIGRIEEELVGIVKDQLIDLVVLGSRGRRYFSRWFIGSVTEHILRKVPVPILTVSHVEKNKPLERGMSFKRILYATDLGDSSHIGMSYAADLARQFSAELTVVSVVEYLNLSYKALAYLDEERTQRLAETRKHLDEFVAREQPSGMNVKTIVVDGKAYEQILSVAEENGVDCIIQNLQSKSDLERAFLGSTAERIVRLAHVPVFSIPFKVAADLPSL